MGEQLKIPEVSFFDFLKRAAEIVKNPLPFHHDNFEKKGDIFLLNLGIRKKVLFSRNAEFLKYVLQKNQKNFTKSEIQTKEVAKYIGKGLLTAEGKLWKQQRKLIQPTFHKQYLAQLLEIMQATIKAEVAQIPKEREVAIEPYFGRLAFQVVAKSLFSGAVADSTIARLQEIVEASQKMLVRELRQPYLGWWFKYGGLLQKHYDMVAEARGLIREIIHDRKRSKERKGDLLDLLLEATYEDGSFMEEEQMIDEIMILFTAGHETTSNALTFTCQLLAKHPAYQEQLKKEAAAWKAADALGSLQKQRLTKQVLEEGMRLYPPAYFIDRKNIAADQFKAYQLEAGTSLLFSVIEIHRHKDLWEAPLEFKPERFEGPASQFSDRYFPFGAGPRMCIGNNFAMLEMQLVLTELLSRFQIESSNESIEILPLITLRPKNARITLKPW